MSLSDRVQTSNLDNMDITENGVDEFGSMEDIISEFLTNSGEFDLKLDETTSKPHSHTQKVDLEENIIINPPSSEENEDDGEAIIDLGSNDDSQEEDTGDEKSYGNKFNKSHVIVAALIVIIAIIFLVVNKNGDKSAENLDKENTANPPSSQNTTSPEVVYQTVDVVKQYPEYVNIPTEYFSDKMVVSKYTTMQDNTVVFYFMGIPENYKQKITFAVSATAYNQIANSSVILIDYKIITMDGKDYLLDVVTNIGNI